MFSDSNTIEEVDRVIAQLNHPILHVSTVASDIAISISKFNLDHMYEYVYKAVAFLKNEFPSLDIAYIDDLMHTPRKWEPTQVDAKKRNHFITLPNELALESLGYEFNGRETLSSLSNSVYPLLDALKETVNAVVGIRENISKDLGFVFPPKVTLILATPSLYRSMYTVKANTKRFSQSGYSKGVAKFTRLLQRQTGFSFILPENEKEELISSPMGRFLFNTRHRELAAFTSGISIMACNHFAPALRLPPSVNNLHPLLKQLADCARGGSQHKAFKINKIFRSITASIQNMIDPFYTSTIDQPYNTIKLICDAPMEWMPIRELPLMLRFDVSRIPATPGNLMFEQATDTKQIILNPEAFNQILVIRSFDSDDPIKDLLKTSIDTIIERDDDETESIIKSLNAKDQYTIQTATYRQRKSIKHNITWVDIANKEEFITAVNSFSGPIMIFDGHGAHDKSIDSGSLKIGQENVNVWELRDRIHIPPIVILSACDTHPIDRSHASTANAFLNLGAKTVLATLLPIAAKQGAIFVARLLLRMQQYVPAVTKNRGAIRWVSIVGGLLRMSYVTDIIYSMVSFAGYKLSSGSLNRILSHSNI